MSGKTNTYAHIVAARPNFIKAAPLIKELSKEGFNLCTNRKSTSKRKP